MNEAFIPTVVLVFFCFLGGVACAALLIHIPNVHTRKRPPPHTPNTARLFIWDPALWNGNDPPGHRAYLYLPPSFHHMKPPRGRKEPQRSLLVSPLRWHREDSASPGGQRCHLAAAQNWQHGSGGCTALWPEGQTSDVSLVSGFTAGRGAVSAAR